jgi:hypothetical protein
MLVMWWFGCTIGGKFELNFEGFPFNVVKCSSTQPNNRVAFSLVMGVGAVEDVALQSATALADQFDRPTALLVRLQATTSSS